MTSRTESVRGRRVEVPEEIRALDTLRTPDYAAAWVVGVSGGEACSAERWVRAIFEDAPHALRAFIVAGWRTFLGLRLGPRDSPDLVIGWRIVTDAPDLIILESQFRFGTAHNLLRVDNSRVLLATFVRYEKRGGRTAWALAAPLHHRIIPYLLGRAASGVAATASA